MTVGMRIAGVTLIEMMIGITIVSLLIMLAVPSMTTWLSNTQIRNAAETMLSGITLARSEALRRNAMVRFQLTTSLTSSCTLSITGINWVVSLADPTGACQANPSDTATPQVIQKKSGSEGSPRAEVSATGSATIYFNGLGRIANPAVPSITSIDITNSSGGTCQHVDPTNGTMRCMRIVVSGGGDIKMCDPAVTDTTDPRHC